MHLNYCHSLIVQDADGAADGEAAGEAQDGVDGAGAVAGARRE